MKAVRATSLYARAHIGKLWNCPSFRHLVSPAPPEERWIVFARLPGWSRFVQPYVDPVPPANATVSSPIRAAEGPKRRTPSPTPDRVLDALGLTPALVDVPQPRRRHGVAWSYVAAVGHELRQRLLALA